MTDRTRAPFNNFVGSIFLNNFYHIVSDANCTKFGNPSSIIADFHFLALKKVQKGSKKAKNDFFEKSKKMRLPIHEGELNSKFEPNRQ